MEPFDFVRRWNDYLSRTGQEASKPLVKMALINTRASLETVRFLSEAGLPLEWSGPFEFDFEEALKPVSDVYGCYGKPGDWDAEDYKRLNAYLYLGFDGGNNPVCLDPANGDSVVFLIYARMFDQGEYINSSVAQLAECILIYDEMLNLYWQQNGEDAELFTGAFPKSLSEPALLKMKEVDPKAFGERSYWSGLLQEI